MTDSYESRATTHAADCWSWGPAHYECAVAEIERLREQLRLSTVDQATAEAEASDAHAEDERLRAVIMELLDALRQIAEWPDGGNLYGQEKIKRFAQHALAAHRKQGGQQ